MNGRKLNTKQADALKKTTLRKGRISDMQPYKSGPSGAQRREFARARDMEHKIEEFFTAPRNIDFSVDIKEKKRRDSGKRKRIASWHAPLSNRYVQIRDVLLGEKYRAYTITATSLLLIVVLVWLSATLNGGQKRTPANAGIGGTDQSSQVIVDPDFDVIEPSGGADTPPQFDPSTGVASFADTIDEGSIVVSQQVIPEDRQDDESFLLGVSQSFNATKSFRTENGEVYLGTNQDNGTQFLAFIVKDKLILIQSQFTQTDENWKKYVNSF